MTPILPLIPVDPKILSSFDDKGQTGGPRERLVPLCRRASGVMIPEAARALSQLQDAVLALGGDLRITDCHRSALVQAAAHQAYLEGRKKAYVAEPGRSYHNAGRAVDLHLGPLKIPLAKLWEAMKPLGWSAIIDRPDPKLSEAWHIEWRGELAPLHATVGYADAALAGALLVGHAGKLGEGIPGQVRLIQALCHRAGVNVGPLDGVMGPQTRAGVEKLLGRVPGELEELVALLSSRTGMEDG